LTDGQTPLYVACKEGHESIVKLLLSNNADPHVPTKLNLSSPLHVAVQSGNAMIVDMLLEKGAEMNPPGEPLLHIACSNAVWKTRGVGGETGSVERMLQIIRLLLQQGVNVNAFSDRGDTALYRACESEQLEVVQILLEAGADVNLTSKKLYPLIAACDTGNVELMNLLMKAGADVTCRKSNDETCLHAVINSSIAGSQKPADIVSIENIIKSLLEDGVDVSACCSAGETALCRASEAGYEHIVRLLLKAGADTRVSTCCRLLYAACERGHTHIVDLLLRHGADPNTFSVSSERHIDSLMYLALRIPVPVASSDSLPIICAVQKGYTDIVNLLLKHGADVNKQDQTGKSALITFLELMASRRSKTNQVSNPPEESDFNILKSMLLAGGDANMLSRYTGQNALHIASSFGMCDVMTELIQLGTDCNELTSSGKNALDLAFEKGHEEAVELLLKNGAKPDRKISTACGNRSGLLDVVSNMLQVYGGNPNKGSLDKNPLVAACLQQNVELVDTLLKHGADPNLASKIFDSDSKRSFPLFAAADKGNIDIITLLLNAGANVNAMNDDGKSVLCLTAENLIRHYYSSETSSKKTPTIRLLLQYGANVNMVMPDGRTLLSLAVTALGDCCIVCVVSRVTTNHTCIHHHCSPCHSSNSRHHYHRRCNGSRQRNHKNQAEIMTDVCFLAKFSQLLHWFAAPSLR